MNVKNETIEHQSNVIDDITEEKQEQPKQPDAKLEALRAKLAKKTEETNMPPRIIAKKTRSLEFGVIGSGQAGSNLAACWHKLGYPAVVFNTAPQDLEHLDLPESNKYLLEYGLGGAAKEIEIGKAAAEAHKDGIYQHIADKLHDCNIHLLCLSLGGGSGAGSADTLIDILSGLNKPLVVITVLPMSNEDAQTKRNALETLSKLAKATQNKQIHNLIVVDNAKIETIYSEVSQFDFYSVSNKAIVAPLDAFNTFSSLPSSVKGLDPMEFAKLMTDGGGLTVYGELTVPNFEEDDAIAEAVISNLNSGLLAGGFDLKQSKYVGVLIVANKSVWDRIPSLSVNYAMTMINDICGTPSGTFKGIYSTDMEEDVVKVYSMFCGLGLPEPRVQQLKKEAEEYAAVTKSKDHERNLTLKLDTGVEEATSQADKITERIHKRNSAFGGLLTDTVRDRRKR